MSREAPGGRPNPRLEHDCEILAPISAVWDVVSDIPNWPDWTPTVSSALKQTPGPISVGTTILVRQPLQRPAAWTITSWNPGRGFSWRKETGALRLRAEHHLIETGRGTRSLVCLEAVGFRARLIRPALAWALTAENRALKRRLEGPDRDRPRRK